MRTIVAIALLVLAFAAGAEDEEDMRPRLIQYNTVFSPLDESEKLCTDLFVVEPGKWVYFREMVPTAGENPSMPVHKVAWSEFLHTVDDTSGFTWIDHETQVVHITTEDYVLAKDCLPEPEQ